MNISDPATKKLALIGRPRAEVLRRDEVRIGHDLLELLTQAMYVNPLTIYREYVQNASDAIDEGRTNGIFRGNETGRVDVSIDVSERTIRIRDNGASIPRGLFVERLLSIGFSHKRGKRLRGFRGIGRLSGLGYCQELIFRGRADASEPLTEITWSARKLKDLLNSDWPLHDLQSAIVEIVTVNRFPNASLPRRFFEVELRKVLRIKNDVLLNTDAVYEYLSQVAPVRFSEQFEYGREIDEFLQKYGAGGVIDLVINGNTSVQRPHVTDFKPNLKLTDKFSEIEFFEIPGHDGLDAIGWVLHHGYLGALQKKLNISGLRLRMGNIQIGESDILAALFGEPRFNSWCVGEFHIQNQKILPNGRRDNFEHSIHYANVQSHIARIATQLSRTCRSQSAVRNMMKSTKQNIEKIESDLNVIRSMPFDLNLRNKYVVRVRELISMQKARIEKHWPQNEERDNLIKRVIYLERKLERLSESGKGTLFKDLPPARKRAYNDVLSAMYEVVGDASLAQKYLSKILRLLRVK